MSSTVVHILSSGMSRARRFEQHGVTLKFPAHSVSGVRSDDGTVVFAIAPGEIECDEHGWKCLLWTPREPDGGHSMACACSEETLGHCELALQQGGAEGFVLHKEAQSAWRDAALPIEVKRLRGEFWATWQASAPLALARRRARQAALAGYAS